jgi:antitoxin component of MazEF toxin-antitoxin module
VKLQRRFNRKVGNKEYSKWIVVLPEACVAELGWKEGTELESNTNPKNRSLELKPKRRDKGNN